VSRVFFVLRPPPLLVLIFFFGRILPVSRRGLRFSSCVVSSEQPPFFFGLWFLRLSPFRPFVGFLSRLGGAKTASAGPRVASPVSSPIFFSLFLPPKPENNLVFSMFLVW